MKNTRCPCVADALFGTKAISVNGKTVGIARLCDAIAAVQGLGLSGDNEIRNALLPEGGRRQLHPEAFAGCIRESPAR